MAIAEGRHGTPAQIQLGRFFVEEMIPSPFLRKSRRYQIEPACERDLPEIVAILDGHNRKCNFAPRVCTEDLIGLIQGIGPEHFRSMLVAREAGQSCCHTYYGRYEDAAPERADRIADFASDRGCGSSRAGFPHSRIRCAPRRQPSFPCSMFGSWPASKATKKLCAQ